MTNNKFRDKTVDIAKGIGIILVILAHTLVAQEVNNLIYLFHMPLFFFISGITAFYSCKEEKVSECIKKNAKSILIPYFVFSIIFFIYWFLIERKIRNQLNISVLDNFFNIFIAKIDMELYSPNVVMWFLPCLFTTKVLFCLINKIKQGGVQAFAVLLSLIIGIVLSINNVILPWGIETALIALAFMYIAYKLKSEVKIEKISTRVILNVISIIGIIICMLLNNEVDMLNHKYGNIILFFLGAFSGINLILNLSKLISKNKPLTRILEYLGINSLMFMIFSEPIKRIIIKIVSIITKIDTDILRANFLWSFLITIIVIITIMPVIYLLNRFIPIVIGKSKNKRKNQENMLNT